MYLIEGEIQLGVGPSLDRSTPARLLSSAPPTESRCSVHLRANRRDYDPIGQTSSAGSTFAPVMRL